MDTSVRITPLPQYQSHKKVWALKIRSVEADDVRISATADIMLAEYDRVRGTR